MAAQPQKKSHHKLCPRLLSAAFAAAQDANSQEQMGITPSSVAQLQQKLIQAETASEATQPSRKTNHCDVTTPVRNAIYVEHSIMLRNRNGKRLAPGGLQDICDKYGVGISYPAKLQHVVTQQLAADPTCFPTLSRIRNDRNPTNAGADEQTVRALFAVSHHHPKNSLRQLKQHLENEENVSIHYSIILWWLQKLGCDHVHLFVKPKLTQQKHAAAI